MSVSKIDICNLALAHIGANAIKSLEENNKRARMCKVFYPLQKNYLLRVQNWSFARKFLWLEKLDLSIDTIDNEIAYGLPTDCARPVELTPRGSKLAYEIRGNVLYTQLDPAGLYYISKDTSEGLFTDDFVALFALGLAVKISPAITQDTGLTKLLAQEYSILRPYVYHSDASVDDYYKEFDMQYDNDTFVSGG